MYTLNDLSKKEMAEFIYLLYKKYDKILKPERKCKTHMQKSYRRARLWKDITAYKETGKLLNRKTQQEINKETTKKLNEIIKLMEEEGLC